MKTIVSTENYRDAAKDGEIPGETSVWFHDKTWRAIEGVLQQECPLAVRHLKALGGCSNDPPWFSNRADFKEVTIALEQHECRELVRFLAASDASALTEDETNAYWQLTAVAARGATQGGVVVY